MREESRGGHTRDDFPTMSAEWRKVNLVCSLSGGDVKVVEQPMPPMRPDLLALFDPDELAKYYTEERRRPRRAGGRRVRQPTKPLRAFAGTPEVDQ